MAGLLSGLAHLGLGALEKEDIFDVEEKKERVKKEEVHEVHIVSEEDFLFEKSYTCPVCGNTFNAKTVKAGKAKLIRSDADLRPVYEQLDVLKYDIVACNKCGYAAMTKYFPTLGAKQIEMLKEKIAMNFTSQSESKEPTYSYDEAIGRYKLALASAVVKHGRNSERAYICLKAAWILRGKKESIPEDTEGYKEMMQELSAQEDEFLQYALDGFVQARGSESFPICGMDELTLDYLIAAMAVHMNQPDTAKKYLGHVLTSRTVNKRLKDKALELKESIK